MHHTTSAPSLQHASVCNTASESRRVLSAARAHMLAITGQRQANAASCSKRCKVMQIAMLARVSHRTAASRMQMARHASGRSGAAAAASPAPALTRAQKAASAPLPHPKMTVNAKERRRLPLVAHRVAVGATAPKNKASSGRDLHGGKAGQVERAK